MFCIHCGTQNIDGSKFCAKCGSPLIEDSGHSTAEGSVEASLGGAGIAAGTAADSAQPVANESRMGMTAGPSVEQSVGGSVDQAPRPVEAISAGVQPAMQAPAATPSSAQPVASATSQPPFSKDATAGGATLGTAGVPVQAPAAPAQEGVISAAWNDIKNSPNWLKRVLLLGLIGCIPIMNFAVDGYCIRWGRDLSFGKRSSMPKTIFKKKEISTGFFAFLVKFALWFVLSLVALGVMALVTGILSIPSATLGLIALSLLLFVAFLFSLLVYEPCIEASVMRMSVVGYLESGFNFRKVFSAFKKSPGSVIGASVLPRLLVGIVAGIVIGIFVAIVAAIAGAVGAAMFHGVPQYGGMYAPGMIGSFRGVSSLAAFVSGAASIVIFVVVYIVASLFNVFAVLLTYRAIGHWVARTTPEWAEEAEDVTTSEDDDATGAAF